MGTFGGPNIIRDGLVLYLDSSNRKSNIRVTKNMIDNSSWTVGYSQTGGWPSNGDASQNEILYDTDPWGNQSLVLKTHPNNPYANGGWEGISSDYWIGIDKTKKYRSTVWVRRTSSNNNGYFYHGLHTDGTGDIINSNNGSETNPYWTCATISSLEQNQWYLDVGYIHPYNSSFFTENSTGIWSRNNGWITLWDCNIGGDARFPSDATLLRQRVYHYYANDASSNIELFNPRIDLCDGTEPTINELLEVGISQWKDLSGNKNHHSLYNTPVFSNSSFILDGSQGVQYSSAVSNSKNATVVIFYKTTDNIELWVKGQTGSYYIAASYDNGLYYQENSGSPTYYADLLQISSPILHRNGEWHMWEAKNIDFSSWTRLDWFLYGGTWNLNGSVAKILVYDRPLTSYESINNFKALKSKYGI